MSVRAGRGQLRRVAPILNIGRGAIAGRGIGRAGRRDDVAVFDDGVVLGGGRLEPALKAEHKTAGKNKHANQCPEDNTGTGQAKTAFPRLNLCRRDHWHGGYRNIRLVHATPGIAHCLLQRPLWPLQIR